MEREINFNFLTSQVSKWYFELVNSIRLLHCQWDYLQFVVKQSVRLNHFAGQQRWLLNVEHALTYQIGDLSTACEQHLGPLKLT